MATKAQDHTNRLFSPHSQKFLVIPSITLFLCALVPLWLCLLSSTSVENPLQISSFLTNKANFRKSQMNVSIFLQKAYENISDWTLGENKPNSKPIKANTKPIKANKMPKQSQYKPNTKPNKANFKGKKICFY